MLNWGNLLIQLHYLQLDFMTGCWLPVVHASIRMIRFENGYNHGHPL